MGMAQFWRRLVVGLTGVTLFVASCGMSATLHARLPTGRKALAEILVHTIDAQIAGSSSIGEIVALPPGPAVVRDLVFRDASGRRVLRIHHAEVVFDFGAFFSRRVVIERARVRGGEVLLAVDEEGEINLKNAFASPTRAEEGRSEKQVHLGVHGVRFEGIRFVAHVRDERRLAVADAAGGIEIVRRPGEAARIRLDGVSARVIEPRPLGLALRVERLDGVVRAQHPTHAVDLRFAGLLDESPLRGTFNLRPKRKTPADLDVEIRDPNFRVRLLTLGGRLLGRFSDSVDAKIRVSRGR